MNVRNDVDLLHGVFPINGDFVVDKVSFYINNGDWLEWYMFGFSSSFLLCYYCFSNYFNIVLLCILSGINTLEHSVSGNVVLPNI